MIVIWKVSMLFSNKQTFVTENLKTVDTVVSEKFGVKKFSADATYDEN